MNRSISAQFGNPSGLLGELVGLVLTYKNKQRTDIVVSKLNVNPNDYILEIGFGSGTAVQKISRILENGVITGADHSPVMFKQASNRNSQKIGEGKVRLYRGTIFDVKFLENYFDKVFAVNVNLFWKEPSKELGRIKNLLKPGGSFLIALQPRYVKTDDEVKREGLKIERQMLETGFGDIRIELKKMRPVSLVIVTGRKAFLSKK